MGLLKIKEINNERKNDFFINRMQQISQKVWWESCWDYIYCPNCWKIHSISDYINENRDLFSSKINDIIKIKCLNCNSFGEEIYWKKYKETLKYKYSLDWNIYISCAYDDKWEIIWYNEWYYDTIENIYNNEFKLHYDKVWINWFKKEIINTIWFLPEKIFIISWVCLIEEHRNMYNIFKLMKNFANQIKTKLWNVYWIAELDYWHPIYKVTKKAWWITLNFNKSWLNQHQKYNSRVMIIPNIWKSYWKLFGWTLKDLIKI